MSELAPDDSRSQTTFAPGSVNQDAAQSEPLESIESAAERLRAPARSALGVTGTGEVGGLREVLTKSDVGIYPALALGLLVAVDQLQTTALTILGPEITGSLGIPRPAYALVIMLKTLVTMLASLPIAALVQGRARRAAVSLVTAFAWAALTATTGFVISVWGLLIVAIAAGAATASVRAVHQPLLLDSYPPASRARILSFYRGFDDVGDIAGPVVVLVCSVVLGLTWRGSFLGLGAVALVAALAASRLRDPGFGRWDTERVRAAVSADDGGGQPRPERVALGFFEIARRLMLVPTIRRVLSAWAVYGMFLAPYLTYRAFFLQERWGMGPGGRAAFSAVMPVFGLIALRIFAKRGEEMFRRDPARLLNLSAVLLAVGISLLAGAVFMPFYSGMLICFGIATGILTVITPAMALPMYSIVKAEWRPHLGALHGVFLAGIGGAAGLLLLAGIESRFGVVGAILSLALPGVAAGFVLQSAARTISDDLERMLDEIVEEEQIGSMAARGVHLPLLSCRGVEFSYGQLQVLFGVDLTVDEGEMVALLGTNGAGKSTLLRVISGLGLPNRGNVRYRGADVSYVNAERRLGLGICQVPGGRAIFGPLSVIDNLRVVGYSLGRDRRAINAGIEASLEAFPRLHERRDQLASTLSGGEQQMLGLATAFMLRPRLLLIDELSLGLAPKVVGELLGMVRRINAMGTAVVLVEQSVTVALSVVDHAYFMEKGTIRFDGPAQELRNRPDLLRSVFLDGAAKGLLNHQAISRA